MNASAILNEVIAIEAFADELKIKASGLRKKLDRFSGPAPSGVKNSGLSEKQKAKLVGSRRKTIIRSHKTHS